MKSAFAAMGSAPVIQPAVEETRLHSDHHISRPLGMIPVLHQPGSTEYFSIHSGVAILPGIAISFFIANI